MNKSVPQKCIYLHLVKVFNLTMCIKSTSKDLLGYFISRGRDDRESFLNNTLVNQDVEQALSRFLRCSF